MKHKKKIITFLFFTFSIFTFQFSKAQMFWNQAAKFAGSSVSYVSVPNSASLNITGSFSIEAWVNPANTPNKGVITKGGALGTALKYAIRITSSRVSLITNGTPRLTSRSANTLPGNSWTQIAATYNSSGNQFKIFINGQLDTSAIVAGAAPGSNTDSLYVGISGSSTGFNGQLDEVRLWNRTLSETEVAEYYRTSMAEVTGVYNGLILSMTFQEENSSGSDFTVRDISGNGNNGNARNVTPVDMSNNPYNTIQNNESVKLDGVSYLAAKDTSTLDAQTAVAIECWVFPLSNSPATYISKGSTSPAYFLGWSGTKLIAKINNSSLSIGSPIVPLNQWSHIALIYRNSGVYRVYINGKTQFSGINAAVNINNNSDSLYIGGGPGTLSEMNGYIDEVHITKNFFKSDYDILNSVYISIDAGNDPDAPVTNISYNLDGLLVDNCDNGGPKLRFVGNSKFSHSAETGAPVAPTIRDKSNNFSNGYFIKTSVKPIPQTGSSGTTYDTLTINQNVTISDLNFFVALNHDIVSQLDIVLKAPNGDSVKVFDHLSSNSYSQNIVSIFDDQADSTLSDSRFAAFSPAFKPANSLNSALSGDKSAGKWIIKITDDNSGETGVLYAWGFQLNNQTESKINLNVNTLIQGFYNSTANLMNPDTMKIYIREIYSPFAILDSSSALLNNSGLGLFNVSARIFKHGIQIQLKHRNSLETWTSDGLILNDFDNSYDFTPFPDRAFGDNQIEVNSGLSLFGIYSGDVDQNGLIDLSDVTQVFNDANNFLSGYIVADVTGDNLVDLSDLTITYNNSSAFVSKITP